MQLKGINTTCVNEMMKDAFKKAGVRCVERKPRWPRAKAIKAIRIDCGTGNAVAFVR